MTTTIDAVGVRIDADNTGLRTGLQSAEADIGRFSKKAVASLELVTIASGAMITGLAGLAIGAGFQALKKTADELEAIGVKANTIGILSTELQEFGHVARRVDVDQEKLNAGLQKFAVFLGQARMGVGPLDSSLKQLNPTLLEQLKRTTDVREAFLLLSDATAQLKTPQDQLNLAQAAFSRGGTDLVRVLQLGREGINDLAKEGNDLGFVFSDLTIQAGGELSDAIEESATAFSHQLKQALIDLGPTIIWFMDLGNDMIYQLRSIASAIKGLFVTSQAERLQGLAQQSAAAVDELRVAQEALTKVAGGAAASFAEGRVKMAQTQLDQINEQLRIAEEELIRQNSGPMGPTAAPAGSTPGALPRNFADEEKAAREAAKASKKEDIEAQRLHNAELAKYNELRKLEKEILMEIDPIQGRLADSMDKINKAYAQTAIDANEAAIAMSKAIAIAANSYADGAASIARDLGKVFEGNKAVAIATALINTFQSVTNAWANVPWPLNIAAAAAALAAGMAQVANIRKTTAKGGGSAGAGSSGGGGSGGGMTQVPQQLMVQGLSRDEFFSGAQLGPLINQLLKFQRDGGEVVIQQ